VDLTAKFANTSQQALSRCAERSVLPARVLFAGVSLSSLQDHWRGSSTTLQFRLTCAMSRFEGCAGLGTWPIWRVIGQGDSPGSHTPFSSDTLDCFEVS